MTGNGFLDKTRIALKDICLLIVDSEHKTAPLASEGYPYVRTPNIGRGFLDLSDVRRVSHDTYVNWTRKAIPKAGDLVLAREAPVGNVSVVPKNVEICLGQRTVLLRPNPEVTVPQYLCYLLLSDSVQHAFHSVSSGATVSHLNLGDIRELELSIPPLPAQKKIASVLSAYDDLIENNERRIKILEEMAESIYREWFVNYRYPGHENVRMVDSELGEIPEGWGVANVGSLGTVVTGKTPSKRVPEYFGEYMPFIKPPDMRPGMFAIETGEALSEAGIESQPGKTLPSDTICVSCIGTAGLVCITAQESQTNQQINAIVSDSPEKREFIYFTALGMEEIINRYGATGATMVNLSKGKFEALPIIFPPEKIIIDFHNVNSPLLDEVKALLQSNQNLRQTRDLLLPKLISGELNVEELDIAVA